MAAFSSVLDDRYRLTEQIGTGGYSEVWSGHDLVLDRPVAVKLLHAVYAADEDTLRRFRAEARNAGLLSHENVARIYDFGDPAPEHPPYLVMELVEGESLAETLEREGAIGPARTLDVIRQAAAGLHAAHQAGLIHRDVKPANLLLNRSGTVKVTDFGISQVVGSVPLTRTGLIVGSPGYLAPERAFGAQATVASDLYALGIVAYECLTGSRPFTGTVLEVAFAHHDRPFPPLPPSVPPELTAIIDGLTAKDPAARLASAAEVASMAAGLSRALTARPPTAPDQRPPPVPTAEPPRSRWPAEWWENLALSSRWRQTERRFAVGVGIGAAMTVLVGVLALSLIGTASPRERLNTGASAGPASQSGLLAKSLPARVNVDRRALIGELVTVARAQLRRHQLAVRIRWQVTTAEQPGRVVGVRPAGMLAAGSVVTLIAARAPTIATRPPAHRHGDDGGDGHGDGGQKGHKSDGPGPGGGRPGGGPGPPGQGNGGPPASNGGGPDPGLGPGPGNPPGQD